MSRPRIDLHTHSAVSDGTDTPAELVAHAHAAGVTTLALTDHDITAGWDEAAAALPTGMTLIRGAEFSTESDDGRDGRISTHLLGYLFDPTHQAITAEQERLRASRRERIRAMGERLAADGYDIDGEALLARFDPDAPVGRPHLARALMEAGVVATVSEAFDELLAKNGPYYVEKQNTPITTAIDMIHAAGGVAVFAHPFARRKAPIVEPEVIEALAEHGLDGVEVDHADHDGDARARLRAIADATGLLPTGSSDYHGTNKTIPIAAETTDPEVLAALVDRARGVEVLTS